MKKRSMRWGNWFMDNSGESSTCEVSNTNEFNAPACWSARLLHYAGGPLEFHVRVSVGSWKAEFVNVNGEASAKRWAGQVARELLDLYARVHGERSRARKRLIAKNSREYAIKKL